MATSNIMDVVHAEAADTYSTCSNDWNLFHFIYFFTIVVCAEHHALLGGTRNTYTRIHTNVRTHIYIYIGLCCLLRMDAGPLGNRLLPSR